MGGPLQLYKVSYEVRAANGNRRLHFHVAGSPALRRHLRILRNNPNVIDAIVVKVTDMGEIPVPPNGCFPGYARLHGQLVYKPRE